MMDYIDGEIKNNMKQIHPIDEVEKKFKEMLDAIEENKRLDPTFTVKHPLKLTTPFPTEEAIAKVNAQIKEKKEKELARERARYLPPLARANLEAKKQALAK